MLELLAKYQKLLRLQDWDIRLYEENALGTDAATKTIYNSCQAIIRLRNELSDVEKEKSLIHELLHLIFRDAGDIFDELVKDDFANMYCLRQHERAIEKTAQIIYRLVNNGE